MSSSARVPAMRRGKIGPPVTRRSCVASLSSRLLFSAPQRLLGEAWSAIARHQRKGDGDLRDGADWTAYGSGPNDSARLHHKARRHQEQALTAERTQVA